MKLEKIYLNWSFASSHHHFWLSYYTIQKINISGFLAFLGKFHLIHHYKSMYNIDLQNIWITANGMKTKNTFFIEWIWLKKNAHNTPTITFLFFKQWSDSRKHKYWFYMWKNNNCIDIGSILFIVFNKKNKNIQHHQNECTRYPWRVYM